MAEPVIWQVAICQCFDGATTTRPRLAAANPPVADAEERSAPRAVPSAAAGCERQLLRPKRGADRRLVNKIGLAVLLGLIGQPQPNAGHVDQRNIAARIVRFLRHVDAFGGEPPVVFYFSIWSPLPTVVESQHEGSALVRLKRATVHKQNRIVVGRCSMAR